MSESSRSQWLDWLVRHAGPGETSSTAEGRPHLDDETLAALLEAGPGAEPPVEVLDHLSRCNPCRRAAIEQWRDAMSLEEMEDLPVVPRRLEKEALRREPAGAASPPGDRRSFPWFRPVPVLAGAAIALVLSGLALLLPRHRIAPDEEGQQRAMRGLRTAGLLAPSGRIATGDPVVFEWAAVPGAVAYEVVVADPAAGSETILRLRTDATRRALSPEERSTLAADHPYQWLLKTERGAGRWESSGPVEFVIDD